MRHVLICISVLCFLVSIPLSPAHAEVEFTIKQVDPVPGVINLGEQGIGDWCLVGNLNPTVNGVAGWLLPSEVKLAFDPATMGDCEAICPVQPAYGIDISVIRVRVDVDAACTLMLGLNVEEVAYPTSPDCPEPGDVVCASPMYQVDLPQAGGFILTFHIECPCLTFDKMYMLGVYMQSATCEFNIGIDNIPTTCTNWFDWGEGWKDLVAEWGFPGNLRIWADATCCEPPVPVEKNTWGKIKSLYRD